MYEAQLLIAELNRRQKDDKLKYYRPHDKQRLFHMCQKHNRWILGGNRTGKTESSSAEAVWYARGNHPFKNIKKPMDGWVVSLTNEVQRDVVQRKILSYINPEWIVGVKMREGRADDPNSGIIDFINIQSTHGGISTIGFKSCDQGREKFQGTSKDFIVFDEEPPYDIYQECVMRTLDCNGYIWGAMTPLKGLTWVYNDIYLNERNDPEVWSIAISWEDNPYLEKDVVARMVATMTEEELESRREGRFVAMSGLVYNEFRDDVHVIDPFDVPRAWHDNISIDPGLDNPLSAHWYAVDHDGNIYVIAEHYKPRWNIMQHMMEIERISRELHWPRDSYGRLGCIMDAAADQHSLNSEKSVAELFREAGLNVNTHVNKSKWAGIQRVKQYLILQPNFDEKRWPKGKPKLFIFRTCTEMIKELKGYRWKENQLNGREEPKKEKDHAMDDLRYYIMSQPDAHNPDRTFESPLIKHKKQLARKLKRMRGY